MDSVLWTIIGAAVTVIVAILNWATSIGESIRWEKRAQQWALLLAALFTAYGSWRAFLFSEEKTWKQAEVQFRSDWLQQKQLQERLRYEKALRAKADEIAALNREIVSGITGGDSFVYVMFTVGPKSNDAMLSLGHQGKYPVFDVSIEMFDTDELDDRLRALGLKDYSGPISRQQMIELSKPKATFNFPTVRPNMGVRLRDIWQLPADRNAVRYSLAIFTRNGILSQTLMLQRVNGSWRQASQIFKASSSKKRQVLLYEWADPEFPRNKKGKVAW